MWNDASVNVIGMQIAANATAGVSNRRRLSRRRVLIVVANKMKWNDVKSAVKRSKWWSVSVFETSRIRLAKSVYPLIVVLL